MTTHSPSNIEPGAGDGLENFVEVWIAATQQVVGQIANAPVPVSAAPENSSLPVAGEGDLWMAAALSGGLRGEMSLRVPQTVLPHLAQLFLGESSQAVAAVTPEHREAVAELLRQIGGYVITGLKPRWGETQLRLEPGTPPSWSVAATGWVVSSSHEPCPIQIEWRLSPALHAALAAPSRAAENNASTASDTDTHQPGIEGNLDLLMDVPLSVTLRFGARNLLLRQVLELASGSVVELDRTLDEPVDLLLDEKVIARGEVVIVDGNFGLRVSEVVNPTPPRAG